jgi:serine/threonine-protein kinase
VAKLLDGGDTPKLTQTGVMIGTPAYMAPEQVRGLEVDHRADIYALGVLAYEAIVGRHPFKTDSRADMAFMHLATEPPRPSTIWTDVPAMLEQLLLRMLAKDPVERPSLSEIRALLTDVRRGLTSSSDPSRSDPIGVEALTTGEAAAQLHGSGWSRLIFAGIAAAGLVSAAIVGAYVVGRSDHGPGAQEPTVERLAGPGPVAAPPPSDPPAAAKTLAPPPPPAPVERTAPAAPRPPSAGQTASPATRRSADVRPLATPATLVVRTSVKRAAVQIDGRAVESENGVARVELEKAGWVRVTVDAPNRKTFSKRVRVARGRTTEIEARLPAEARPSEPRRPKSAPTPKSSPASGGEEDDEILKPYGR